MLSLNPATWMKDSALGPLKPRSATLKALDAAIAANHPHSSWPLSFAVAKAFLAWSAVASERSGKPIVQQLERDLKLQLAILREKPNFSCTQAALLPYFNACRQPGLPGITARQTALNNLPKAAANADKDVLQIAINTYPDAYYLHVSEFGGTEYQPAIQPSMPPGNKLRYYSAEYKITAKAYFIVPRSKDLNFGMIQHCTAKCDQSEYSPGVKVEDLTTFTFPIGDSASDGEKPWYIKRAQPSPHCTEPGCRNLRDRPAGEVTVEMTDQFVNNFHFSSVYPPGRLTPVPPTTAPQRLTKVDRQQHFTTWLAVEFPATKFRLLKVLTYSITVDIPVNGTTLGALTTRAVGTAAVDCIAGAQLPAVSAPVMNNMSKWRYKGGATAAWQDLVTA